MIPYIPPNALKLGPIEPFGLFAAAGIWLAATLMSRAAKKMGLDTLLLIDFAPWGVGGGLLGGHWVHLFLYHPEEIDGVLRVFKVWDGLSSFGGLLGGIIAAVVYFRVRRVSFWKYADALALGLAPGWAVARLGCFVVHDHPGTRTDFPLAVDYPGGARHDLGMYDALALFLLTALLYSLNRAGVLRGRLLPLLALLYGIQRFFTDFLRATDVAYHDARYAGLTPAQYGCILLVGFGLFQLATRRAPSPAPPEPPGKMAPAK